MFSLVGFRSHHGRAAFYKVNCGSTPGLRSRQKLNLRVVECQLNVGSVECHFEDCYIKCNTCICLFSVVQINIKRCQSDGCDTRIHGIKIRGSRLVWSFCWIFHADWVALIFWVLSIDIQFQLEYREILLFYLWHVSFLFQLASPLIFDLATLRFTKLRILSDKIVLYICL